MTSTELGVRTSGAVLTGCPHQPPCPSARAADHAAARIVAACPEQGWNLHCNGVVTFDDNGELMPDGTAIAPHLRSPENGR